jgi:hypothetical protein
MQYKFLLAGMLFTSFFLAGGCGPADIEPMIVNEDGSVSLTDAYVYKDATPAPVLAPHPYPTQSIPVNPAGVSIKTAYTDSAGNKRVELMGKVPQWTNTGDGVSANGIPEGLHKIITGNAPVTQLTDYPRPTIAAGDQVYDYTPTPYRGKDIPLENNIRLGSLYNTAKYTAVTISGLAESKLGITMKETGSTVRLFTEAYLNAGGQNMTDYDRSAFQWRRITFGSDPNKFPFGSYLDIPRGSGSGGLNVLVWEGATPKNTALEFSYDGGRTWTKTVVDYSGVSFEDVPLEYMAWYKAPQAQYYPNANSGIDPVTAIVKTPKLPAPAGALGDISDFNVTIGGRGGNSIADNFLIPSFYPANATNKQVYLTSDNTPQGSKMSIDDRDGEWTVEIADRIRVTCKKDGAADKTYRIFCDTYPPEVTATPVTIVLELIVSSL